MLDDFICWLADNPRKAEALGIVALVVTVIFVGMLE